MHYKKEVTTEHNSELCFFRLLSWHHIHRVISKIRSKKRRSTLLCIQFHAQIRPVLPKLQLKRMQGKKRGRKKKKVHPFHVYFLPLPFQQLYLPFIFTQIRYQGLCRQADTLLGTRISEGMVGGVVMPRGIGEKQILSSNCVKHYLPLGF